MSHPTRLRFGNCEIDFAARTLWRGGQPHHLEPRVFDALTLLIRERHRVVRKQELIERIWSGRVLSSTVIPRALARARRAIGDDPQCPSAIRTVHAVGYQFVAEVSVPPGRPATGEAPTPGLAPQAEAGAGLRIGVLHGAPGAEPGGGAIPLVELLCLAITTQTGWPARSMHTSTDGADAADMAQRLARHDLTHALQFAAGMHEVQTTVDWSVWTAAGQIASGREVGVGDIEAVNAVALRFANLIFGAMPGRLPAESENAFVLHSMTRAQLLQAREDWAGALRLYELVVQLEPDNLPAQVGRMLALRNLRDARASQVAQTLLARALRIGDERTAQACRLVIQQGHFCFPGERMNETQGPVAATGSAPAPEALDDMGLVGRIAAGIRHANHALFAADAMTGFDQALAHCRLAGNPLRLGQALQNMAAFLVLRGELPSAAKALEESIGLHRRSGSSLSLAHASSLAALVQMQLGEVTASERHADECLLIVQRAGDVPGSATILSAVSLAFVETGDRERARRMKALLDHQRPQMPEDELPTLAACEAARDVVEGRLDDGRGRLRDLLGHPAVRDDATFRLMVLYTLLRWDAAAGDVAAVERAGAALQAVCPAGNSREIQAAVLHAAASLELRAGRPGDAVPLLQEAIGVAPPSRLHAVSRLDLAAILAHRGEPDRAELFWAASGRWSEGTPLGQLVRERIDTARGRTDLAARAHQRARMLWRGPAGRLRPEWGSDAEGAATRSDPAGRLASETFY